MFHEGAHVRSPFHGYGRVLVGGPDPVVGFLDGRKCRVAGDTVTVIPDDEFVAVALNMLAASGRLIVILAVWSALV